MGPPFQTAFPQWSHQGDRVALVSRRSDGSDEWKITILSPKTREFERLSPIQTNALHPSWSPDDKRILFGTIATLNRNAYLYIMDLETKKSSVVPGSQGLFTPVWSPNGRYIAALKADSYQLVVFDSSTSTWRPLPDAKLAYPVWSPDSQSIFTFRNDGGGPRFYRVDVASMTARELLYLKGFRMADRWIGLDPFGNLLVAQNIGIQEIVALHLSPSVR